MWDYGENDLPFVTIFFKTVRHRVHITTPSQTSSPSTTRPYARRVQCRYGITKYKPSTPEILYVYNARFFRTEGKPTEFARAIERYDKCCRQTFIVISTSLVVVRRRPHAQIKKTTRNASNWHADGILSSSGLRGGALKKQIRKTPFYTRAYRHHHHRKLPVRV